MLKFSTNLKTLRKNMGLKQSDMEKYLGYTQSQWSSYENKIAEPSLEGLMKIANFFNVTETDLLHKEITGHVKIKAKATSPPPNPVDSVEVLKRLIAYQEAEIHALKQQQQNKPRDAQETRIKKSVKTRP